MFFLSNVIIIKIFRGSSTTLKPSEELDFDSLPFFSHSVYEANATADEAACEDCSDSDTDQDGDEYHGYDGYDEDNDDDGSDDDLESEDEEDYKDLERRIEEFISKNYKQRNEEQIHERFLYMASMENCKNPALARWLQGWYGGEEMLASSSLYKV